MTAATVTDAEATAPSTAAPAAGRFPWIVTAGFAFLLAYPYLASYSLTGVGVQAAQLTIVAVSLVILVGWVGQISLGHAALVGIGGYTTGWATTAWGLRFPFSVLVAGLVAAVAATILGSVALRVRGLYLAVATLIFSWLADEWLFRLPAVIRHSSIEVPVIGDPDGVPRFDLGHRPTMFYVAWGVTLVVLLGASALRRSGTGRAWFAVRGSEIGAASLGIDVTRTKLQAFVVSGFLAGVAGSLIMLDASSLSPEDFNFTRSLFFLAIAVVGGLTSLGGAVASSIFFAGLNELFYRVSALGEALDLVSAVLLSVMLLLYRGGLAAVPGSVRGLNARARHALDTRGPAWLRWFVAWYPERLRAEWATTNAWLASRRPGAVRRRDRAASTATAPSTLDLTAAPGGARTLSPARDDRRPMIEANSITVSFGGLMAVANASLQVREHEIVGLIGPNGAGKTTFFNAIAGLNSPAAGVVRLFGDDVTELAVHQRALRGVARTFQAIQLFPELDVFDNLLVATHVHNDAGFFRQLVGADAALRAEMGVRDRVEAVIHQLELGNVAHRRVGDLPFGVLRVVELGRALVTGFPLLMLDEPASGLDNAETERFSSILRRVRADGTTLLLIEHDVQMVVSLCDYIYVLNQGEIIAEGTATEIQANPAVRAAYLGTEEPAEEPAEVTA